MKEPYRIHFGTNQVAIYGYSPNNVSHNAAKEFIERGYNVRLVNPNRTGEEHLGRSVIPSVHTITGPFFVSVYRNPAKAISDGAINTFTDTEPNGVIVNPLDPNHNYLGEHRDELIDILKSKGIKTVDECSIRGLEKRTMSK